MQTINLNVGGNRRPDSITLTPEDNGVCLRCEDTGNVTVTAPATLPEGFNVGLIMWSTGTITVAAGSGAANRGGKTSLSTQYNAGSLCVIKNADGASAEFGLGGDFA